MLAVSTKTLQDECARIKQEIEYLKDDFDSRWNHPVDVRACAERSRRLAIELKIWADKVEFLQQSPDFGKGFENYEN